MMALICSFRSFKSDLGLGENLVGKVAAGVDVGCGGAVVVVEHDQGVLPQL
jgi:hypothetical protein